MNNKKREFTPTHDNPEKFRKTKEYFLSIREKVVDVMNNTLPETPDDGPHSVSFRKDFLVCHSLILAKKSLSDKTGKTYKLEICCIKDYSVKLYSRPVLMEVTKQEILDYIASDDNVDEIADAVTYLDDRADEDD